MVIAFYVFAYVVISFAISIIGYNDIISTLEDVVIDFTDSEKALKFIENNKFVFPIVFLLAIPMFLIACLFVVYDWVCDAVTKGCK